VGLIDAAAYARDLDAAVLVLEGRDSDVTQALQHQMQLAAEQEQFERAAALRDQLVALRKLQAEQTVAADSARDVDAFAVTGEPGDYCISVLLVRGGRSLGTTSYFPRSPGLPEEVLASFLLQHYAREEVPGEVLTSLDLPDRDAIVEALSLQQGRRPALSHPGRGLAARWVNVAADNATQALGMRRARRADAQDLLVALAEALQLPATPGRIECFDISHTAGEGTVASCVVFTSEGAARKEYRRFNIEGVTGGDDYAALAEAVRRRYTRVQAGEYPVPDVLLIDGGPGQVAAVYPVLQELGFSALYVLGVSKGADRRPGQERMHRPNEAVPLVLPADGPALRLIQRVRDEAHRFAIQGHRRKRARRHQDSILETVPGLGPARRRALLRHFGGLQGVLRAGVADLTQVKGIGAPLARVIYDHLHPGV
jgi:excinuclease ABC subunit C